MAGFLAPFKVTVHYRAYFSVKQLAAGAERTIFGLSGEKKVVNLDEKCIKRSVFVSIQDLRQALVRKVSVQGTQTIRLVLFQ